MYIILCDDFVRLSLNKLWRRLICGLYCHVGTILIKISLFPDAPATSAASTSTPSSSAPSAGFAMDAEKMKIAQEQLRNMDAERMRNEVVQVYSKLRV